MYTTIYTIYTIRTARTHRTIFKPKFIQNPLYSNHVHIIYTMPIHIMTTPITPFTQNITTT